MSIQISATTPRAAWLRTLALAPTAALEAALAGLGDKPRPRLLRPPQTGLAMVQGRIGGTGGPFNLGEITVTRAAVQVETAGGAVLTGVGHVAGREPRKAELVALFDALLQDEDRRAAILADVVEPLETQRLAAERHASQRVAESRVDFVTMVRGE